MNDIINKTLGGLSKRYYFRQLFFGLIFFSLMAWGLLQSNNQQKPLIISILIVLTLLYPYSRFVYESVVSFIFGDNEIYVGGILFFLMLWFKLIIMCLCWIFSIFIAPFGLAYLYYYHTKNGTSADELS